MWDFIAFKHGRYNPKNLFQFNRPVQRVRSDSIQSTQFFVVSDSIQSVRLSRSDSIRFSSFQNPIQRVRSDSNFLNQTKISLVTNVIQKSIFMSNCVWGVILNFWATFGCSEIQDLAFPNDFSFLVDYLVNVSF